MNPEIKATWVKALRSGKYQQAHGVLQVADSNSYCCLGVLCSIAVDHGVVTAETHKVHHAVWYTDLHGNRSYELLPMGVAEWAGLPIDPEVVADDRQIALTELNDGGHPFEAIARLIEEQL